MSECVRVPLTLSRSSHVQGQIFITDFERHDDASQFFSARRVSLAITSLVSGNTHVLNPSGWTRLTAGEIWLSGIPIKERLTSQDEYVWVCVGGGGGGGGGER